MLISVIIPTLNEEKYLGTLLEFLMNHPKKNLFEIIVVDGGSDDNTLAIATDFDIALYNASVSSRAVQMNLGAKKAKGDILYFVHADVQLVSSFLDDIMGAVNQGIESGCYRFKFDNPENPLLWINGFFTRFPFIWCRGGDQTLFITKAIFERLGGFDDSYVIMEDYNLIDRLSREAVSFKIIPKSIKVSSRKYDANSYLKTQIANLKAMRMYMKGVKPEKIKKFYIKSLI